MQQASDEIIVDGLITEQTWQEAEVGSDFWQKLPYYAEGANPKTEIRLSYDDNNLYVVAKCYQEVDILVRSLKRDEFWNNDGIGVVLDPMNSRTNSVLFGLSAVGVQWDATRAHSNDTSSDWSNKWHGETTIGEGYWIAEFAIPLRILRYEQDNKAWGLNFVRGIQGLNQFHNWTAVPEGFWPPNAAFAGSLLWEEAPKKSRGNYNVIPYVAASVSSEADKEGVMTDLDIGTDAKIALGSALNLDLTFNPNFSQAEADQLVTNLSRFNIFLPERRNFFLENADIFGSFGNGAVRPFFSRRIGLDDDLEPVPILYGARMTGNVSPRTRVGVMNIHSRSTDFATAQNQSAVSVNQQFGRSFVQGMFLNKQGFDNTERIGGDYSRNLSLEGLYASDNGQINVWGATHFSFKPGYSENTNYYNTGFKFRNPAWEFVVDLSMMQENYFTDMGYIVRINNYDAERDTTIRVGYNNSYTSLSYQIRPIGGKVAQHRFQLESFHAYNPDWSFNEQNTTFNYNLSFRNTARVGLLLNYNDQDLLFPFSFTDETPLPADRYKNGVIGLNYDTDERKKVFLELSASTGGFYNGTLSRAEALIGYRVQPWGNFSIGYEINDLKFPQPYGEAFITALVSEVEIGFSRNLLWTTLFQFVDQSDFMGFNSRLQWRFSPMSDLFLVYVDNYDITETAMGKLNSQNRALILKVNYWY